ncbi:MAG: asparagine synthase-related protein [Candidatus Binatia bacterium]
MSAIYGIVGNADTSLLRAMGARLAHRGSVVQEWQPDTNVFFGSRSGGASRLLESSERLQVAADASLFNREAIAEKVKVFNAQSEPELIQRAFMMFGTACLSAFNGDFAIAYWDSDSKRLLLTRDPVGARVLYYWQGPDFFAFAPEYKALLALETLRPEPDMASLQYFQNAKCPPWGKTLLQGIHLVPAGFSVEIQDGRVTQERYWRIDVAAKKISIEDAELSLKELFLKSVSRRIDGSGPVGVTLSGGVDSAAIVAAVRHLCPTRTIKTFTIGTGPKDPEVQTARLVADHFHTDHHEMVFGPEDLPGLLPRVVWHLEDPIGRTEVALYYAIAKLAAEHVNFVLGGFASDALYAGMPRHKIIRFMQLAPFGKQALEDFYYYSQVSLPPSSALGKLMTRLYYGGSEIGAPSIVGAPVLPRPKALRNGGTGLLNNVLKDSLFDGPMGPKVEKPHAAHGVTFSSPFFDVDMIRFAFEIPETFKLHGFKDKYILRRALTSMLPEAIVRRPKFPQAMDYGLRLSEVLDSLADRYLSEESLRSRGFFNLSEIAELRRRPSTKAYSPNPAMRLWTAIVTELWATLFIDRRGAYLS